MGPTVDDIYNIISKNTEYSSQLKKNGNQITVYTDISIKNKEKRKSKIREIRDYLKIQAPQFSSVIAYNANGKGSSIGRIEIGRGNTQTDIVVYMKPIPKVTFLQNWLLNEEMFADISTEYKDYADEDGSSYKIIITDGTKNISIDNVKSITRVGGENKKPDIKIVKTSGKTYKISLKMTEFVSWESQSNSNPQIDNKEAIKILNNLKNITAAFGRGSSGVSAMATLEEVKTVCFGGDGPNNVDYVVTADFSKLSPTQSFQYNQENQTLTIRVNKIYSRNIIDYEAVRKNCYMLITKVSNLNISLSPQYRGYQISFVPFSRVQNTIPGKR
jgi:hypothetical protein